MGEYLLVLLHLHPVVEVLVHADGWSNEGDDILLDVVIDAQMQCRFAFMFLAVLRQLIDERWLDILNGEVNRDLLSMLVGIAHEVHLLYRQFVFCLRYWLGLEPTLVGTILLNETCEEDIHIGFEQTGVLLVGLAKEGELVTTRVVLNGISAVWVALA